MEVQWVPGRKDQLIAWAQDINLYRIETNDNSKELPPSPLFPISQTQSAVFLAKVHDIQYPKTLDPYPGTDSEGLIAVGLGTGKIVLSSFGSSPVTKEFVPKHQRTITSLNWNKHSPNFFAAGFEKSKDFAVAVWDVGASCRLITAIHSDILRPTIEIGNSETAHSIAWVGPKTLLVGMNGKHIKLFDLRADTQPKLERTASTKAVYGISMDGNHRVGSFGENQAYVWDTRNFEKPFVVLHHQRNLIKIGWCPTRPGLLACLERESSHIQLHDVHHAALSSEDGLEPAVLERSLIPAYTVPALAHYNCNQPTLSSLCWHPTEENCLTTITGQGTIWNNVVFERITLNWSSTSKLSWSNGKKIIQYIDNADLVYSTLDDISVKMKQRAVAGYGLKNNLKENSKFVEDDEILKHLWEWLDYCKTLAERDKYKVPSISTMKFPGVRSVLRIDSTPGSTGTLPLKSEIVQNNSLDLHNNKTYRSVERTFIQHLCGWGMEGDLLPSSPSRKAAIALFHLKLRQAIRILSESGNSIAAISIAGFSEEMNSLWREQALSNSGSLSDPYIRAIFSFLTETDNNYESILNDHHISVADRVGFACSFLPDSKLVQFIQDLTNEMNRKGNLEGILLTGMSTHCTNILQSYLDKTGDVQTISLLAIRTMANDIPTNPLLKFWISQYRELLNSWKLWEPRAEFDIIKNNNNPQLMPPAAVTVSCNFCGKNISPSGTGGFPRNAQLFTRFAASSNTKVKYSCCPHCRKPLPRCAICLLHMGTVLGSSGPENLPELQQPGQSADALSWYTWCQSCRHGGHAIHIRHWFMNQIECPVTGCNCKCITLDKVVDFPK